MDEITIKMIRLAGQGFRCSQVIMILGLEIKNETNPWLVKAMTGLAGGCGNGEGTCGALTGGCCLLGLFAGKGSAQEYASAYLSEMQAELVEWFRREYTPQSGTLDCSTVRRPPAGEDPGQRCSCITRAVFEKCLELLNKYDLIEAG